jgi:hypothetical protein
MYKSFAALIFDFNTAYSASPAFAALSIIAWMLAGASFNAKLASRKLAVFLKTPLTINLRKITSTIRFMPNLP